ncbi:MAG: SLBB domain-containing protein [Pseudomonadota bacterium]|nr:SLBB domain-containing protein [Pseudomonadota bacterium]
MVSGAICAASGAAVAQTSPYGQYDAYGNPTSQTAPDGGNGNQAPGYNQQAGSGQGQPQNGGYGAPYGIDAGAPQSAVPTGGYSPLVIPNTTVPPTSQENATVPVTRPGQSDAIAPPLYARPGAAPGQFQLYTRPPPPLSDFEKFVAETLGRPLPRFGASLVLNGGRGFATGPTTTVPPDYALNPGDELLIGVTGSVEADLRLVIDSEGRIFVPRIGAINIAGVRYGDLAAALQRRFDQQFKKAKVSVVIGRLHGITVYVTGYAVSPGAYTVSSLSTLVDAVLAAGGPSAGGSFRSIQLRRGGQLVTELDLYDLLLTGDKTHDAVLQNEDVLNVGPAGPEVAVTGAVNAEAIYEAKPGETLGDVVRYAGGFNSLADETRVVVSRLADLDTTGSQQLTFAAAKRFPAERGDIVRVLSLANVARPLERQAILATIEGEVDHAGRYYLTPGSTLADLLAQAGGMTAGAFVFGTELDRDAIREQQQASFDKAIDNLELAAAAVPLQSQNGTADRATSTAARGQASLAVIERLKARKPDGRLVLNLSFEARNLPGALALENNDRIFIPPRPTSVGVFGAVYEAGSFAFTPGTRISDYLRLSGGPQKIADKSEIFVVRANGSVQSSQQIHGFANRPALPGDVIFVPVRTSRTALEKLLDIATLVYQFGIGALALKAIGG